jgi:hypothetical protein
MAKARAEPSACNPRTHRLEGAEEPYHRTRMGRVPLGIARNRRELSSRNTPGNGYFSGVAEVVEDELQQTEKPEVDGSTPSLTTTRIDNVYRGFSSRSTRFRNPSNRLQDAFC